ncbi:hypothetical protein [Halobacillus trueperi]|uniref:Uncharacterized protein n=1 Tax=Halobacillus trueperi TaxID=156205 RepID=A0A3E0JDA4_9BACI|nr:hypothetical protein [Halobacillus trueperi]REJ10918.1 hypothetical protein DYE48_00500 [Halobacillus trueperi]
MKENLTFAWIASWFALVGQLAFFIVVALFTGEWRYVMWSLLVSLSVGVPNMIRTWQAQKKANARKIYEQGESSL